MLSNLFSDYNLTSFFKRLKKGLVWMLLSAIVGGALMFAYSWTMLDDTYTSYATVYISRYGTGEEDDSKEANTSRFLATTCMVVLKENAVAESAFDAMENKGNYSARNVASAVSIVQVDESPIIKISCTHVDAQFAYDVCVAYSKIVDEILVDVLAGGSCQVITQPKLSAVPQKPNYLKLTAYGALIGLLIALLIIVLVFIFDQSVKSSSEIENKFGLSVWAEIPSLGKSKKRKHGQADIEDSRKKLLGNNMPFIVIESYKSARTNLAFILNAKDDDAEDTKGQSKGCAIMFTSAEQNAGKTITTANMALTTAKKDAKVLIVDADMRKPLQHKLFDLDNEKGLSSVLAGVCSPTECIFKLQDNLHIMPAGKIPPNPSELLDTKKMSRLLKAMCSVYDYVFIDTPPAGMVADACVIAPKTDGVIIVVREGRTSGNALAKAIEALKIAGANILGAVLTDIKEYSKMYNYKKNRYKYRYRYSYGSYEYHDEDKKD